MAIYYDVTMSIDLAYLDVKEGAKIVIVTSNNYEPKQEFYGSDKLINVGVNLGAELNLTDGIWILLNMGNNWSKTTDSKIVNKKWSNDLNWSVDLRFHLPEKMKL